jgi:Protein of unknown function (DUF4239)
MSAFSLATLTFVCAFGGALVGGYVRSLLPATHLSKESQDVMRLGMGLVATMTALLLGLVTASARSAFDSQDAAIRASAANILTLDRLLARYGPETVPIRDHLKKGLAFRIQMTWPADGSSNLDLQPTEATSAIENIENGILQLTPATETQRWFKSEALKLSEDISKTRWRVLGNMGGSVPVVFLAVVMFWLTVTFTSFGLYTQSNASVVAVLFVAAFSVAAAVFLIMELDGPFDGVIKVSSAPLRYALSQLGQ